MELGHNDSVNLIHCTIDAQWARIAIIMSALVSCVSYFHITFSILVAAFDVGTWKSNERDTAIGFRMEIEMMFIFYVLERFAKIELEMVQVM